MLGEDPFILTSADSCAPISRVVKVFFFPRRDGDQAPIVQNLKSALAQTLKTIPLLAGSVKAIAHEHQLGRLAITAPWTTADEILTVKDLTKTDFLDYETLRSMHFPMVHVDYGVLLTLPDPGGPRPVLMAQINFIKGGLILGTVIDHGFTDGNGFVSVLKVWAAYCRGDDGARTIAMDSLDRTRLMEGRGAATIDEFPGYTYVGGSDNSPKTPRLHPKTFPLYQRLARMFRNSESWLTKYLRFPINLGRGTVEELLRLTRVGKQALGWTKDVNPLTHEMFFFPRTKLNELKELAGKAETNPKSDDTEWISTNDALASLLWCCITTAVKREKLLHKRLLNKEVAAEVKRWLTMVPAISNTTPSEPVSTLGFLMNARRLMRPPVSQDYIVS